MEGSEEQDTTKAPPAEERPATPASSTGSKPPIPQRAEFEDYDFHVNDEVLPSASGSEEGEIQDDDEEEEEENPDSSPQAVNSKNTHDSLLEKIAALEAQLAAFADNDNEGLLAQLEHAKKELAEKIAENNQQETKLCQSMAEVMELKEDMDVQQKQMEEQIRETAEAKKKLQEANKLLDGIKVNLASANKDLSEKRKALTAKNKDFEELEHKFKAKEAELEVKVNELRVSSSTLKEKEMENRVLKMRLEKKPDVNIEKVQKDRDFAYQTIRQRDSHILQLLKEHKEEKEKLKVGYQGLMRSAKMFNTVVVQLQG